MVLASAMVQGKTLPILKRRSASFSRNPHKVPWWLLRKLHIPKWLVNIIKAMYYNQSSKVCVEDSYSDSFGVNKLTKKLY